MKLYPFFDADFNNKVKVKHGEDKVVVFNDDYQVFLAVIKPDGSYELTDEIIDDELVSSSMKELTEELVSAQ